MKIGTISKADSVAPINRLLGSITLKGGGAVVSILSVILITRLFDIELVATFFIIQMSVALSATILRFGLDNYLIKECAIAESRMELIAIIMGSLKKYVLRALFISVSGLGVAGFAAFIGEAGSVDKFSVALFVLASLPAVVIAPVVGAALQGRDEWILAVFVRSYFLPIVFSLIFFVLYVLKIDGNAIGFGVVIGYWLVAVLSVIMLQTKFRLKLSEISADRVGWRMPLVFSLAALGGIEQFLTVAVLV